MAAAAPASTASASAPATAISLQPASAVSTAQADIPIFGVSETIVPTPGAATASATAPTCAVVFSPSAGAATASAFTPFYGVGLVSSLTAAQRALLIQQVVIEAELVTAEAALASATTPEQIAAAQTDIDHHAARFTYCAQSLEEVARALTLCSMFDPIGA